MDWQNRITQPTLVIDEQRVRANIAFMAAKAAQAGVRFRPHFKTHQSLRVGEWFREAGVEAITVSSVDMAVYFAEGGWEDITIAFPLNVREIGRLLDLSRRTHLGVLVESLETVQILGGLPGLNLDVWLKIDTGYGRTGLAWDDRESGLAVAAAVQKYPHLHLRGLLTHAGYTYTASSPVEIVQRYQESVQRIHTTAADIALHLNASLEISVGDTPGCTLAPDLGLVDEIRPGNFVFYDAQMLRLGVCPPERIAAVMACPLVALHPERLEAVVYGGAVHFSKDTVELDGRPVYGYVVPLTRAGWGAPLEKAALARVSQEHGILTLPADLFKNYKVGDLVGVLPAHVCLAVACLRGYQTLDGEMICAM